MELFHLQFEEIFRPYSRYCSEQINCREYCKEQDRDNEIFKAYLAVSVFAPCQIAFLRRGESSPPKRLITALENVFCRRRESCFRLKSGLDTVQ